MAHLPSSCRVFVIAPAVSYGPNCSSGIVTTKVYRRNESLALSVVLEKNCDMGRRRNPPPHDVSPAGNGRLGSKFKCKNERKGTRSLYALQVSR